MQDARNNGYRISILAVDDEKKYRNQLEAILGSEYNVLYSDNGKAALEILRHNSNDISLCILDINMPELDGYQVLEIMRRSDILSNVPVIATDTERQSETRSFKLGAQDFIYKPFGSPETILARVKRAIEYTEDKRTISETEADSVTGLYTKEYFFHHAKKHDLLFPGLHMDAVAININRFHMINGLYGRGYGERVLKLLAERIFGITSERGGIAGHCDVDYFYIYLPHSAENESLLKNIENTLSEEIRNRHISIRVGIYGDADMTMSMKQRFYKAILVCNRHSNYFRTSYNFYDKQMHQTELYSERLILDLDNALLNKHFKVCYQPQYDISGEKPRLASAEALVRWEHPKFGLISPAVFVPLFEENGLIYRIDRYVWDEAAAQVVKWQERFGRTIPVSVNVSRMDMFDSDLPDVLFKLVQTHNISPEDYVLEITESAYTDNSQQIINTVEKLREKGFRIGMDDFGSGYSSLNMLASLPVDILKLDRKFIRNICVSEKDLRMVEMILGVAEFLNIPVVAEGAETEEQYRLLKRIGCNIIQGFYFSEPVPPDEFGRFISELRIEN